MSYKERKKFIALSEYPILNEEARLKGFSIRPEGEDIAKDLLVVVGLEGWRANLRILGEPRQPKESIVFRVTVRPPRKPYILRGNRDSVWVYTPPGALIKRAMFLIRNGERVKAVSDLRMAFLTNIAELENIPQSLLAAFDRAEKLFQLAYRPGTDGEGEAAASKAFDAFCKLNRYFQKNP